MAFVCGSAVNPLERVVFKDISSVLNGEDNGNGLSLNIVNVPIRVIVDGTPTLSKPCRPFQGKKENNDDGDDYENA